MDGGASTMPSMCVPTANTRCAKPCPLACLVASTPRPCIPTTDFLTTIGTFSHCATWPRPRVGRWRTGCTRTRCGSRTGGPLALACNCARTCGARTTATAASPSTRSRCIAAVGPRPYSTFLPRPLLGRKATSATAWCARYWRARPCRFSTSTKLGRKTTARTSLCSTAIALRTRPAGILRAARIRGGNNSCSRAAGRLRRPKARSKPSTRASSPGCGTWTTCAAQRASSSLRRAAAWTPAWFAVCWSAPLARSACLRSTCRRASTPRLPKTTPARCAPR